MATEQPQPGQQDKSVMLQLIVIAALAAAFLAVTIAAALPDGVTIVPIRNETATPASAGFLNTSGGSIITVNLNGTTQNVRWKAFVGNATGKLTLEDSAGAVVYDWTLSTITGEIYATRSSSTVNWTGIGCANATHISNEDLALSHTNKDDNITATFGTQTHNGFYVDVKQIAANSCSSVHTYVNSTPQSTDFEEVALYDGNNLTNGKIIFSTILEQDIYGYNNRTYDFQMIVPERGEPTWVSSTAYYLYVELS